MDVKEYFEIFNTFFLLNPEFQGVFLHTVIWTSLFRGLSYRAVGQPHSEL